MLKTKYTFVAKSGFTLIEIMVVVVIIAVIGMGVLALILNALSSYYTLSTLNELNTNASFAADELTKDLLESGMSLITIANILDPATGESHDILVFPMLSSVNPTDPTNGEPNWHNVVVYYPFRNASGIDQLRKYVYTNSSLISSNFPLFVPVVTATAISFSVDGTAVSFNRASGQQRVLANSISTEDANNNGSLDANEDDGDTSLPMDNANGVLDSGIDYTITGNTVFFTLFLQKPVTGIAGVTQRNVSSTLSSAATLRN